MFEGGLWGQRASVIDMRFPISNTSLKVQVRPQSKYSSVFAWSPLYHPTPYPEQEPSIYMELWNTNKQHTSVNIFQSTSYSQSQASPKKCLYLLLKRFADTFSTRIWCKEYSQEFHPLCCLLTNTNIHRFKTVVYYFSWECHWKLPASVSIVVCGSKIRMYGQHLYQLLHDYSTAKLLKTRWMSLHVIFCYL